MPRPPVIRTFFFMFPQDKDSGEIAERVRPLNQDYLILKIHTDTFKGSAYPERTGSFKPTKADFRNPWRARVGTDFH